MRHHPFDTVLIANRGEIACRIARTCRELGLRTVGVFTEPDRLARHVRACDSGVRVGDYLDIGAVVAAAPAGAAVHPGYGFLAENAEFAQAVLDAGLVWVGPPPAAIAAMGSKSAARQLMAEHGVPVVPGYDGSDQDDATFRAEAERIGLPLLVKASAGGGGKGMSVVSTLDALPEALAQARRLARSAFCDDRLLLERFLDRPRHVEVQVIADGHGGCLHLFERECSIQRRHQKVVEEAPAPAFEPGDPRRAALHADAVRAARAVGYENAGTVEFMVDQGGGHHFLEMNTRLQVEHPVTEAICGLDLVALQLRVAAGRPLGLDQESVIQRGHAIEVRLYAEDADRDYLPSTGRILAWHEPEGVRVDSGFGAGDTVGVHYDPMLAKVVAWGADRDIARLKLARALERLVVLGLVTNRGQLRDVLLHLAFAEGQTHTAFLEDHPRPAHPDLERDAVLGAVALHWARRARPVLPGLRAGWRNNRWPPPPLRLRMGEREVALSYRETGPATLSVSGRRWDEGEEIPGVPDEPEDDGLLPEPVELRVAGTEPLRLEIDGRLWDFPVATEGGEVWVHRPEGSVRVEILDDHPPPGSADEAGGGLVAPMPGKVVSVQVEVGADVVEGQALVVLEAMKMEQSVNAPRAGRVEAVLVEAGEQVEAGQALVALEVYG